MKKKNVLKTILTTTLLLFFLCSEAQDTIVVRDIETWAGLSLEKKFFNKKLALNLNQEFRFDDNSSNLGIYFTEAGIEYDFLKYLKAGVGYRFIRDKNKEGIFKNKQRFNFDLGYSYKFQRLNFYGRIRYQRKNEFNSTDAAISKFRVRLKLKYNIRNWKLDPYFSSEIFPGNNSDIYFSEIPGKPGLQKMRFTLGTSYKVKNIGSLKMFCRLERETGIFSNVYNIPVNVYIIGLNFNFSL